MNDLRESRVRVLTEQLIGTYEALDGSLAVINEDEEGFLDMRTLPVYGTIVYGQNDGRIDFREPLSTAEMREGVVLDWRLVENGWEKERIKTVQGLIGGKREVVFVRVEITQTGVLRYIFQRSYYRKTLLSFGEWVLDTKSSNGKLNSVDIENVYQRINISPIDLFALAKENRRLYDINIKLKKDATGDQINAQSDVLDVNIKLKEKPPKYRVRPDGVLTISKEALQLRAFDERENNVGSAGEEGVINFPANVQRPTLSCTEVL